MRSLITVALSLVAACSGGSYAGKAGAADRPVVVELFTSQGCSSCPPADRLLSKLGADPDVIALAYHVDYWNYIGWRDPFSSAEWSARQQAYARAISARTYTPQLVVDGRTHVVGSRRAAVADAIADARKRAARGAVTATARRDGAAIEVAVDASGNGLVAMVALLESGASTDVTAGENDGRTLANDYIVRRLARADDGRARLPVDAGWTGALSVAVFLQDPDTLAIEAATAVAVAE